MAHIHKRIKNKRNPYGIPQSPFPESEAHKILRKRIAATIRPASVQNPTKTLLEKMWLIVPKISTSMDKYA
jgi:hypothetical protein